MENQEQNGSIPGIDDEVAALPVPDPLVALKAKADLMGIAYHPSIGVDKLREKVNAALNGTETPKEEPVAAAAPVAAQVPTPTPVAPAVPVQAYQAPTLAPEAAPVVIKKYVSPKAHADALSVAPEGETVGARRVRMKRHANELIRVYITSMDPAKKEWEGEIIAAGNNLVGTLSKYIPFGADDGWHVPRIIYNVLRDRMCQIFYTVTDPVSKQKVRKGKLIKAFAIEVLEPLTTDELAELAARQAATRAIDA